MIVADTSFVYALLDRRDRDHERVRASHRPGTAYATTPLVLAEVDHLVEARAPGQREPWYRNLAEGAWPAHWWRDALPSALAVLNQYQDLGLGLTDASLVALAGRLGTTTVATLDERHFRAVRPLSGGPAFRLLPMDAG